MTEQLLTAKSMATLLGRRPAWALVLVMAVLAVCRAESSVHTVFPTECTQYFTWQSMGAAIWGWRPPMWRVTDCLGCMWLCCLHF